MSKTKLSKHERRQMREALRQTRDARHYRRLLAILEHDEGTPIAEIARRLGMSRQSVHDWIVRFEEERCIDALREAPRPGRPARADEAFDAVLGALLMLLPERFGYRARHWTVRLLRHQLRRNLEQEYSDDTIRRGLHRLGYVWKRPRYVLAPDPEREKKTPHSPRPVWFARAQRGAGGG
jgi:transposase